MEKRPIVSYKCDFHTHSVASPDGSLTTDHYRQMLAQGKLQAIAVTDHNTIAFAQALQAELGDQIIVGEEVTTRQGEIIGLYLQNVVPAGLSLLATVAAIIEQGGIVYVPHPFETVRKGITPEDLNSITGQVDIIEVYNGRAVAQNRSAQAIAWARQYNVPAAASSDAHGRAGWGRTYSLLAAAPTRDNLCSLLGQATYETGFPGVRALLYPKFNRLRKRTSHVS